MSSVHTNLNDFMRYVKGMEFAGIMVLVIVFQACAAQDPGLDSTTMLERVAFMSADALEGRAVATEGNAEARAMIIDAFEANGLMPLNDEGYTWPFTFEMRSQSDTVVVEGLNVQGYVRGTMYPDQYIVMTAHYDHLGVRNGEIYNGADDNASGTAGMLAIAEAVARNPLIHSVLFIAFDAEENGLQGARAFITEAVVPHEQMLLNINLDMVSRNAQNELYATGTGHYPYLRPLLEEAGTRSPVNLMFGHEDDWTFASDHGWFHRAEIPFIYFGVEDHPDYHKPTDDYENIDPVFYPQVIELIYDALQVLDGAMSGARME